MDSQGSLNSAKEFVRAFQRDASERSFDRQTQGWSQLRRLLRRFVRGETKAQVVRNRATDISINAGMEGDGLLAVCGVGLWTFATWCEDEQIPTWLLSEQSRRFDSFASRLEVDDANVFTFLYVMRSLLCRWESLHDGMSERRASQLKRGEALARCVHGPGQRHIANWLKVLAASVIVRFPEIDREDGLTGTHEDALTRLAAACADERPQWFRLRAECHLQLMAITLDRKLINEGDVVSESIRASSAIADSPVALSRRQFARLAQKANRRGVEVDVSIGATVPESTPETLDTAAVLESFLISGVLFG